MTEMNDMPKFNSEAEVYDWIMSEMVPETENSELSEEALEMVAGGMSSAHAWKVVSTTYWELSVLKKKNPTYSLAEIYAAYKMCNSNLKIWGNNARKVISWLSNNYKALQK